MSGSDTGSQAPEPITSLAMDGKAVWAASGTVVRKYLRGKEVCCSLDLGITRFHIESKVLKASNPFEEPMTSMLVFGSQLLALSEDGGRLLIWDTHDGSEDALAPSMRGSLTPFDIQRSSRQSNLNRASPPYRCFTPRRTSTRS